MIYRCGENLSVGASSFGDVCHQLEVMRLSRVSDKRRFLVLHAVLCELMALQWFRMGRDGQAVCFSADIRSMTGRITLCPGIAFYLLAWSSFELTEVRG